jgi:hypothetical protein
LISNNVPQNGFVSPKSLSSEKRVRFAKIDKSKSVRSSSNCRTQFLPEFYLRFWSENCPREDGNGAIARLVGREASERRAAPRHPRRAQSGSDAAIQAIDARLRIDAPEVLNKFKTENPKLFEVYAEVVHQPPQ